MSSALPLEIKCGNLPMNYRDTPYNAFHTILSRMECTTGDGVLLGYMGGAAPTFDAGPWHAPGIHWRVWNTTRAAYVPVESVIKFGNQIMTLWAKPTVNRGVGFQDKTGTAALLLDTYVPRATVILKGVGFVPIDWSLSDSFIHRLTGNVNYNWNLNGSNGQKIKVVVQNNGTAHLVNWDANLRFQGGISPAMPPATAGKTATAVYVLRKVNGITYLETMSTNITSPPDSTVPTGGPDSVPHTYGEHLHPVGHYPLL